MRKTTLVLFLYLSACVADTTVLDDSGVREVEVSEQGLAGLPSEPSYRAGYCRVNRGCVTGHTNVNFGVVPQGLDDASQRVRAAIMVAFAYGGESESADCHKVPNRLVYQCKRNGVLIAEVSDFALASDKETAHWTAGWDPNYGTWRMGGYMWWPHNNPKVILAICPEGPNEASVQPVFYTRGGNEIQVCYGGQDCGSAPFHQWCD